ncbi:MAG: acetamidase/formamidase family protein [Burkholderiales bacterium]|nr:acetamidase/formamidase family protein [Burkholderiales bacterium]MDE2567253.1 acetamidase/formamidase family protein [Burkholderiales bacterium]
MTTTPAHVHSATCGCPRHTIHHAQSHHGWDRALPPVLHVAPGEVVEFEVAEASGGQLSPQSSVDDVGRLDFGRINPVTGPVFVDGAEPGDLLKVTLLSFEPSGWGWTANIPGFGLLADEFEAPALQLWSYDPATLAPALFGAWGRVPLKPFAGTLGVAPAAPGLHSIVPPRRVGGNLDVRDLAAGVELYLPVEVSGALFSIGDTHAAQGDGEVCGTAIESPMKVALRLDLVKDRPQAFPHFVTPGPVTRHLDARGYEVTMGIGPDLMAAARAAVRGMVERLAARHGMPPVQAYLLCSVCGDLRISEIVDLPNWTVSFYFPRVVLE